MSFQTKNPSFFKLKKQNNTMNNELDSTKWYPIPKSQMGLEHRCWIDSPMKCPKCPPKRFYVNASLIRSFVSGWYEFNYKTNRYEKDTWFHHSLYVYGGHSIDGYWRLCIDEYPPMQVGAKLTSFTLARSDNGLFGDWEVGGGMDSGIVERGTVSASLTEPSSSCMIQ